MSIKNIILAYVIIAAVGAALVGILRITDVIVTDQAIDALMKGGLVLLILVVLSVILAAIKKVGAQ